jgi:hypothetical protein
MFRSKSGMILAAACELTMASVNLQATKCAGEVLAHARIHSPPASSHSCLQSGVVILNPTGLSQRAAPTIVGASVLMVD